MLFGIIQGDRKAEWKGLKWNAVKNVLRRLRRLERGTAVLSKSHTVVGSSLRRQFGSSALILLVPGTFTAPTTSASEICPPE
jgi:hypothetical protein